MELDGGLEIRSRFEVDDEVLSRLHAVAFDGVGAEERWADRLARFSVSWVGAFGGSSLVGFVHAVWDGRRHAFLLDTAVHPEFRRRGIGRALVGQLVSDVQDAGCEWLHVDYESRLRSFYEGSCGFRPTAGGLLRLPVE